MAENSAIQWLHRDGVDGNTWNPWISCAHATYVGYDGKEHVHPGCLHCYAESLMDDRYGKCQWGSSGNRVVTSPAYWRKPATWEKRAAKDGVRVPVFPSLCDPFEAWDGPMVDSKGGVLGLCTAVDHAKNEAKMRLITMDDIRRSMFEQIDATPNLEWIVFTKRPENVPRMWPSGFPTESVSLRDRTVFDARTPMDMYIIHRSNVTLCYSPANQETLDYGVPFLLKCADLCQTIGLSIEPMLGPVDLRSIGRNSDGWPAINALTGERRAEQGPTTRVHDGPRVGWVIIGCESNGPRVGRLGVFKTEAEWWDACADVVRQCREASVPCFVKQGPRNGRVVHELQDFPEACRVREFPQNAAVAGA